jgi:hypothetical protein
MDAVIHFGEGTMKENEEALTLLRETHDKVIRIETLMDVHLGKDGTLPQLQKKVDGINAKIIFASGAVGTVLFGIEKAFAYLAGK